jgi:N-acetylmuramoyl-L-alanine amidase
MHNFRPALFALVVICPLFPASLFGQGFTPAHLPAPGQSLVRAGDEIIVCGQFFHTGGAPVVTWLDLGGYNAYQGAPRIRGGRSASRPTTNESFPISFGIRTAPLTDEEVEQVRKNGWTLPFLQQNVDQFVYHFDVAGISNTCFKVLQSRGLAVHFMLDIDGTIYQTCDLKENAPHATDANSRSIGVEIANMGAYAGDASPLPLREWYKKDSFGQTRITIPSRIEDPHIRTPNFIGHPVRNEMVTGIVQGRKYRQYDYTPQQYDSLIKLTATLCTVFPKITIDYPRQKTSLGPPTTGPTTQPDPNDPLTKFTALAAPNEPGVLIPHALTWNQFDNYQGTLGHYHVQTNKDDPGPAFQWDKVIRGARNIMTPQALAANNAARGHPAKFVRSRPPATTTTTTSDPAPTPEVAK